MSKARKAIWQTPDGRANNIAGFRRRFADPVERQKIGELSRSRWEDPMMRAVMTEAQYRPDVIERRLVAHRGTTRSDAAKANMGKAQIRRFSKEEERIRISQLQREGWTIEAREQFSLLRQTICRESPRYWITDGIAEALFLTSAVIPDGWRRGRRPGFRARKRS